VAHPKGVRVGEGEADRDFDLLLGLADGVDLRAYVLARSLDVREDGVDAATYVVHGLLLPEGALASALFYGPVHGCQTCRFRLASQRVCES